MHKIPSPYTGRRSKGDPSDQIEAKLHRSTRHLPVYGLRWLAPHLTSRQSKMERVSTLVESRRARHPGGLVRV